MLKKVIAASLVATITIGSLGVRPKEADAFIITAVLASTAYVFGSKMGIAAFGTAVNAKWVAAWLGATIGILADSHLIPTAYAESSHNMDNLRAHIRQQKIIIKTAESELQLVGTRFMEETKYWPYKKYNPAYRKQYYELYMSHAKVAKAKQELNVLIDWYNENR